MIFVIAHMPISPSLSVETAHYEHLLGPEVVFWRNPEIQTHCREIHSDIPSTGVHQHVNCIKTLEQDVTTILRSQSQICLSLVSPSSNYFHSYCLACRSPSFWLSSVIF